MITTNYFHLVVLKLYKIGKYNVHVVTAVTMVTDLHLRNRSKHNHKGSLEFDLLTFNVKLTLWADPIPPPLTSILYVPFKYGTEVQNDSRPDNCLQ